jgi:hypothetical protein
MSRNVSVQSLQEYRPEQFNIRSSKRKPPSNSLPRESKTRRSNLSNVGLRSIEKTRKSPIQLKTEKLSPMKTISPKKDSPNGVEPEDESSPISPDVPSPKDLIDDQGEQGDQGDQSDQDDQGDQDDQSDQDDQGDQDDQPTPKQPTPKQPTPKQPTPEQQKTDALTRFSKQAFSGLQNTTNQVANQTQTFIQQNTPPEPHKKAPIDHLRYHVNRLITSPGRKQLKKLAGRSKNAFAKLEDRLDSKKQDNQNGGKRRKTKRRNRRQTKNKRKTKQKARRTRYTKKPKRKTRKNLSHKSHKGKKRKTRKQSKHHIRNNRRSRRR